MGRGEKESLRGDRCLPLQCYLSLYLFNWVVRVFFAGNDVDAFPWLSETRKRETTREKREKRMMETNATQISPKK